MSKQKLSPQQKKEVARRRLSGEKPKDLSEEYGVSPSLITRAVKQYSTESEKELLKPKDFSDYDAEALQNRIVDCHREIRSVHDARNSNFKLVVDLEIEIKKETERLNVSEHPGERKAIEAGIIAKRAQITYAKDARDQIFRLKNLYQELSAIYAEMEKRPEDWIPVGNLPELTDQAFSRTQLPIEDRVKTQEEASNRSGRRKPR